MLFQILETYYIFRLLYYIKTSSRYVFPHVQCFLILEYAIH